MFSWVWDASFLTQNHRAGRNQKVLAWLLGSLSVGGINQPSFPASRLRAGRDFLESQAVKTALPMEGTQFQSMVWELRLHMPRGVAKIKNKQTKNRLRTGRGGDLCSPLTSPGHTDCSDGDKSSAHRTGKLWMLLHCLCSVSFTEREKNPLHSPSRGLGPATGNHCISSDPTSSVFHRRSSSIQAQGCKSLLQTFQELWDEQGRRLQPRGVS